ncbi:MAG: hypothetical protein N2595_10275 [bacterium]|nr:hypothetical protein [bacterium]
MIMRLMAVYNNWGHYDELGDRVRLTEGLVWEELAVIERWRREFGVSFDVFVIDCLWFEAERGYKEFRRGDWPVGPGRVLERIRELGMIPGLWFSVNGARLRVAEWEGSLCEDNWHYSLADGPYAEALEEGMQHAAEAWGVRYFKLDFANLGLAARGVVRSEQETMRRSVGRLREILGRLRERFEGVHVITHCGFARRPPERDSGGGEMIEVDPGWLDVVDGVFSGDPQCGDIPQSTLCRAIDVFQDRQVWKLNRSGFPLDRIEDHGVLIGRTNTAMYRGRQGFRRSYVGQLARGGRRDMVYGDVTLLCDEDVRMMRAARGLFFDAYRRGLCTRYVGDGKPGEHGWYGYMTGGGSSGLLYLVNATFERRCVELPVLDMHAARVLFYDGRKPELEVQAEHLAIEVGPEQAVVIGMGRYADGRWEVPPEEDTPPPVATRLVPVRWGAVDGGVEGEVGEGALAEGERLLVVAQVFDAEPAGAIEAAPYRFGRQETPTSEDRRPRAHDLVRIRCEVGGREVMAEAQVPDVPVWSGTSWVARRYAVKGGCRVRVEQRIDPKRRLRVSARAVRYAR